MPTHDDPTALFFAIAAFIINFLLMIVIGFITFYAKGINARLKSVEDDVNGKEGLWVFREWRNGVDKRLDKTLTEDVFEREMKTITKQNEGQSEAIQRVDAKVDKVDRTVMLGVRRDSGDMPAPRPYSPPDNKR